MAELVPREPRTRSGPEPVVYVVQLYPPTRWKIGTTMNVPGLLSAYRRVVPEATLLWTYPGSYPPEHALHAALALYAIPHQPARRRGCSTSGATSGWPPSWSSGRLRPVPGQANSQGTSGQARQSTGPSR